MPKKSSMGSKMLKKGESKENLKDPVYLTFFAAFLFLSGTTLITLLAAISANREDEAYLKNALISETAVNIIASVTYYYFMVYLYADKLTLENVTSIRYLDWAFTTPLLLISFVLYTGYSSKNVEGVDFQPLIYIIALNLGMLLFGYWGETKKYEFYTCLALGFACYAGLIYFLYDKYVKDEGDDTKTLFYIFAVIWGIYGISYLLPTREKNISYNILDLISKAGFGVFIWLSMVTENPNQYVAIRDFTP
tara:strand:+ start:26345 stop:27094 length:750 start_codon:yes stop_codon:yes gene_type:complete